MSERELRSNLIRRAKRNKAEIAQLRRDVAWWNRNRPHTPIEEDPDGELARAEAVCDAILRQFGEEEWCPDDRPVGGAASPRDGGG